LRPVVIDNLGHLHAFGGEFLALSLQACLRASFEGKMIKSRRNSESTIDPGVVLGRNPRDAARLHECQQLIAPGIEEYMPDRTALFNFDNVGDHRFETEDT